MTNISQTQTRPKIRCYLTLQNRSPYTIHQFKKGYCHGFTVLGVYAAYLESLPEDTDIAEDNWTWVKNTLEKMVAWEGKTLDDLSQQDKADFDRLISLIEFFQHIYHYLDFGQGHIADYFEDTFGRKLKQEAGFAGLVTARQLRETLLNEMLKYDKRLILLSSKKHALGLFRNGKHIGLFNINFKSGWKQFKLGANQALANAIFKIYKYDVNTPSPLGFHIFHFDHPGKNYCSPEKLLTRLNCPGFYSADKSHKQYSALEIAACMGNKEYVEYYLKKEMPVDTETLSGNAALFYAVSRGHYHTSAILLAHGADINKINQQGKTPLQVAAKKGLFTLLNLLLESEENATFDNLVTALTYLNSRRKRAYFISLLDPGKWQPVFQDDPKIAAELKNYKTGDHYRKPIYHHLLNMRKMIDQTASQALEGERFRLFSSPPLKKRDIKHACSHGGYLL